MDFEFLSANSIGTYHVNISLPLVLSKEEEFIQEYRPTHKQLGQWQATPEVGTTDQTPRLGQKQARYPEDNHTKQDAETGVQSQDTDQDQDQQQQPQSEFKMADTHTSAIQNSPCICSDPSRWVLKSRCADL